MDDRDRQDSTACRQENSRLFRTFKAAGLTYWCIFAAYEAWRWQFPRSRYATAKELEMVILIDAAAIIATLAGLVAMARSASPAGEGRRTLVFLISIVGAALWHYYRWLVNAV